MILPAYPLPAGIGSVLVTMHVPRFVSIVSPGWGGAGSSTWSTLSKLDAWMVMMYRRTLPILRVRGQRRNNRVRFSLEAAGCAGVFHVDLRLVKRDLPSGEQEALRHLLVMHRAASVSLMTSAVTKEELERLPEGVRELDEDIMRCPARFRETAAAPHGAAAAKTLL
jgi:hypothetical protein